MNSRTFLLSHVSKEVLISHIQLDTSYVEIRLYKNKDSYDLWTLLKKSSVTKGTYNLQNLRNEWANFKQYTLNEEYHVVSLIPLREYLNSFQGYLDSLSNTPLEPTELEKANTLLAGVDSVRYQVAIFNFGLLPPDRPPSFNDVKNHLMYLDQLNRSSSTSHPSMNLVPTTINKLSVETPIIAPLPSPVQNYNPTFLTLQPGQCAMCGQLKSVHPEGCPQFGKVVCSACQRPNHASLFCQRIKKDIKKASDTSFPSKGNRHHKRDRENKQDKSHKRRKYKSEDSDSSEDKKDKKVKDKSTKIKITIQESESDDDFAHVFMFRGDDDDTIIDDSYWTQPSSPSSSYAWDDTHLDDIAVYFPYSSGPSSPSTLTPDDNDEEWVIEYQRKFVPIIRNYNMTITLIFMVSVDHMDGFLRVCSHPLEGSIPTTVSAMLAMIGQRIPASHPTEAPPTHLQHHIKLMRLNWIIGLNYMRITHLLLLQSLLHRP